MKNNNHAKWQKTLSWINGKRFYIVLLCCIMIASLTYFLLWSSTATKMGDIQAVSIPTLRPVSTPLPDLSKIDVPEPTPYRGTVTPAPKKSDESQQVAAESTVMPSPTASATPEPTAKPKNKLILPVNGTIMNEYTGESLVYSKTLGDWRVHSGIDIKAEIGSQVKAGDDGIVEDVFTDDQMGITIVIDHQNGLKSLYKNLSTGEMVKKGAQVKRGDIISGVGDTALIETGEVGHLHLEITLDGVEVNPSDWLLL